VTICIAAACSEKGGKDSANLIVAACDTKITTGYYSGDLVSLKSERLHKEWLVLLAGKIGQRPPVIHQIRDSLPKEQSYSGEEVAEVCKTAYIKYQRELAYEKALSPFGFTLDSFLKSRKEIGEAQYQQLWRSISSIQVGFDLLVFGFDKFGFTRIFVVSNPSDENPSFITFADDTKFASIGTGSYLADSALYAYSQYVGRSLEETIYHVLAAKFLSESASDVGEATFLRVMYPDGSTKRLNADFIEENIKTHWINHGKPKIDSEALALIKKAVVSELK